MTTPRPPPPPLLKKILPPKIFIILNKNTEIQKFEPKNGEKMGQTYVLVTPQPTPGLSNILIQIQTLMKVRRFVRLNRGIKE